MGKNPLFNYCSDRGVPVQDWDGEDVQRHVSIKQDQGAMENYIPRYSWKGEEGPDSGCRGFLHKTKIAQQSKQGITEQVGVCVALLTSQVAKVELRNGHWTWTVGQHIQRENYRKSSA